MMYIKTVTVVEDYNKCVFLINELISDKVFLYMQYIDLIWIVCYV